MNPVDLLSLLKTIKKLGFLNYIAYKTKPISCLNINGVKIFIRRGTPDLEVALASLSGEYSCLKYLLPKHFNGLIVDGGAYIGTASIALHRLYPEARIIAIEPSRENYKILIRNIAQYPNITPIRAAISGESGRKLTLINRGTGEWGFTIIDRPRDVPDAQKIEQVDAITLEDIYKISGCDYVGIIKLDIEGGEKELFQKNALQLDKSIAVFAELHDRITEGCTSSFFEFSKTRSVVNIEGEKLLSVKTSQCNPDNTD